MDYSTFVLLISALFTLIYALITTSSRRKSRLPPGPYPFPIIGSLLKLSDKPHRSLATLSSRYGPLMSLKLGSRTTIVVSSPDVAKEFFHTHDISFSGRSIPDVARIVDHDQYSLAWLPTGDQWRRLRRITREYFFSVQRLDGSALLREEKVQELLDHVDRCCTNGKAINIGAVVFTTTLNVLSKYMFSVDFSQYDTVSSQEFKEAVMSLLEIAGKPNLADFFPILKPLDPQGLVRRGNAYGKKLLAIIDRIIDQRLQSRLNSSSYDGVNNDVLDSLLDLTDKEESIFSRDEMRHLFYVLFIAGTDTTSSTLEWAMTELLRNREKMEMTRSEINKFMKNKKGIVQETYISQLPYLQAVIKETLRLHPPIPLLVPHQAIQEVQVNSFIVPKNAQILCNVWAMGRDHNIWSDSETFMPERFLEVKIDYKGQDYEFIPFGAGRRICPGLNIAHRMLHIMLGSLIHKFEWKLEGDVRVEDMDMEEKFGLTLPRKIPLMAIPIKL
ncbi:cytochrome P450 76T24 [Lactuca sativa]|uniref:Cytochrome P450 n=1 Tax=Lactuca sativa TaxID=4236 RepID=A0A9R1V4A4_LACSA|nr:cytochrome P450 76T24 [Lactuca sativa]KAJ0198282.1 hypothetical protein LSAT_V11C700345640 [Lactuca sativa]